MSTPPPEQEPDGVDVQDPVVLLDVDAEPHALRAEDVPALIAKVIG